MNYVQDDTEIIHNGNMCEITYEAIRTAMAGERYTMSLAGEDKDIVVKMVNIGIDSRLQAVDGIFEHGGRSFIASEDGPKWKKGDKVTHTRTLECDISPEGLPVLLRRLFEDTDYTGEDGDDQDVGSSLAGSILMTLGFNDSGELVGREALGLD